MPHSTQYRSLRRRSSHYTTQPITWLILTNKTVQENTDKQTQYRSEKVNNLKYSKTKLPWFSCLLQHSARKRGGLILQRSRAHTGRQGYRQKVDCVIPLIRLTLLSSKSKMKNSPNKFIHKLLLVVVMLIDRLMWVYYQQIQSNLVVSNSVNWNFRLYRCRTLVTATNHYKRREKHRIYQTWIYRISGYIEQTALPEGSTIVYIECRGSSAVGCQVSYGPITVAIRARFEYDTTSYEELCAYEQ